VVGAPAVPSLPEDPEITTHRLVPRAAIPAQSAGNHRVEHDPVSRRRSGDAVTDGLDGARDVGSEDQWKGERMTGDASSDPDVEVVEANGRHADADFTWARRRGFDVIEAKRLYPAVLSNYDRAHVRRPRPCQRPRLSQTLFVSR
jgi:hypothetical protein